MELINTRRVIEDHNRTFIKNGLLVSLSKYMLKEFDLNNSEDSDFERKNKLALSIENHVNSSTKNLSIEYSVIPSKDDNNINWIRLMVFEDLKPRINYLYTEIYESECSDEIFTRVSESSKGIDKFYYSCIVVLYQDVTWYQNGELMGIEKWEDDSVFNSLAEKPPLRSINPHHDI